MFLGGDTCSEQRAGWEWTGWKSAVCVSPGSVRTASADKAVGSQLTQVSSME